MCRLSYSVYQLSQPNYPIAGLWNQGINAHPSLHFWRPPKHVNIKTRRKLPKYTPEYTFRMKSVNISWLYIHFGIYV